jgi:prepilin-type N-terminal cleavage/methylation domain-containing protein
MVRARRGFTLIEAMIVVVLVSVLGLLAVIAYRHWVHTAYLSEAQNMVGAIRAAQESFRAENGGYLPVSSGLGVGSDYPALQPGQFKTAWGGPCAGCLSPNAWNALNVSSAAPLVFGYSVMGENSIGHTFTMPVNGTPVSFPLKAPWYMIEADGDTDGNGVYCTIYASSLNNQLYVNQEGE